MDMFVTVVEGGDIILSTTMTDNINLQTAKTFLVS